ncbi:MAG TPA: dihydrodipicolinate reductase C-terminal domain-containing protein [Longimicrobiales bacterium]|nr:dihydrodipicolinate reductase C-terminal domain-containing protein [Longimicrobiales bacterium]
MSRVLARLAVFGTGRMGTLVADAARAHGIEVSAHLARADTTGDPERARAALSEAGMAIDFTTPDAVTGNVELCLSAGCALVIGTTGWYDDLDRVAARVRDTGGALLWAANFSVGVALMTALARRAGELLGPLPDFDVQLVETHHTAKRDAPSGTAITLAGAVREGLGRDVPITSLRIGKVPGTHELVVDGGHEQLALTHLARDPRIFAEGALRAAVWLNGRSGVYTMDDVLGMGAT